MCVGGTIVYHGLVLVGHGDVLVRQCPACGLHACLGGGAGSVGVEVVGIGQVCDGDAACRSVDRKHQVVDVVAAVVARLAGGEDVLECDVVSGAGVGGEVDGSQYGRGTGVVERGDRHERALIGEAGHDAHLQLVFRLRLCEVELQLQRVDVALESRHGVDAALVEDEAVVATVCVGGTIVDHRLVLVGHCHILVRQCPA